MDTAQWPQEIVVKPIEEIVTNTCPKPPTTGHVGVNGGGAIDRKARPQKEQALNCPRCNSTNTKFCYYNNYSLTQPRYFCKTCRRYWTEGGSLRNIPVGGGSRKNKRSSSLSTTTTSSSLSNNTNNIINTSSSKTKLPDLVTPPLTTTHHQNPSKIHDGQDLNLAFPSTQGIRPFSDLISLPTSTTNTTNATTTTTSCHQLSALELLTGISSRGLNSFMPVQLQDPNTVYSTSAATGFINPLQDFKPTLSFSLEGLGSGGGGGGGGGSGGGFIGNLQESSGRLLFPFEDLKQVSNTTRSDQIEQHRDHHHHSQGDSTGYWTGMLGGGSW